MKEQRDTTRFSCREAVICQVGRRRIAAEIQDVSRGGVRLLLDSSLRLGQTVCITPKNRSRGRVSIEAVVRWQLRNDRIEAGLEFVDSATKLSRKWVRRLFPENGKAWSKGRQRREHVRTACRLPVVSLENAWESETLDLSATGASFVTQDKLQKATPIYLCLPWGYLRVKATPVRATSRSSEWVHCVKFSDLTPSDSEHLHLFVEKAVGCSGDLF